MEESALVYQASKMADRCGRRINGATATAIALGSAALVGVVGAWVSAHTRARGVENLIASQQSSTQNMYNLMASENATERMERIHQSDIIQRELFEDRCPRKVSIWSTQPCGCFEPKCNSCGC